ncbi:MAG TPA: extracellular solute-binding protein [Ktedonobacterales bacterium]|nr:extracellular solute-binding protein [Ktedonobacterales bacterium]
MATPDRNVSFLNRPASRRTFLRQSAAFGASVMSLDLLLAACGTTSTSNITFSTNELPPSSNPAQVKIYQDYVQTFQQAHKGVTIKALNDPYSTQTYFTKAAAHSQEDMVDAPFTDPQLMIQRNTVADITTYAKQQSFFSSYTPAALAIASANNKVYGLPYSGYQLGLMFNIKLIKAAGLDPASPPKTWDDFRAYAKQIKAKTGVPGYVELTNQNTGGWHLTNWIYTGGGDLEKVNGSTTQVVFNNDVAVAWLKNLQAMKFADASLYNDVLVGYNDALQIFAASKAAMVVEASDTLPALQTAYQADMTNIGLWPMPQSPSSPGNATLSGGHVYVFKNGDSGDTLNAAVEWASYYRFDLDVIENSTVQASAAGLPVGFPTAKIFSGSYQQSLDEISKKYANLPLDNYALYANSPLGVRPEPPVQTQAMYGVLDTVVQGVLTSATADPQTLLNTAAQNFQNTVNSGG